jgi:hypothetical protein
MESEEDEEEERSRRLEVVLSVYFTLSRRCC